MVNGTSMLASPLSSLLSSTALPTPIVSIGAVSDTQQASAFAALLTSIPPLAGAPLDPELTQSPAGSQASIPAGLGAGKARAAVDLDAALPATAAEAATNSGKILPVALPEADFEPGEGGIATEGAPGEAYPADTADEEHSATSAVAVAPLALPALAVTAAGTAPSARAATAGEAPLRPVAPGLAATPATEPRAHQDQPGDGGRSAAAVSIAVTVRPESPSAAGRDLAGSGTEPAARPKSARTPEPARIDVSHQPQPAAPAVAAAQTDQAGRLAPPLAAPAPLPMASPTDIDAALDRLVAAREALMPAAAALAIDHADFGEVSIRFEQASDGRLSAELSSADPVLREAVTAAVAAERSASSGADGDSGRSASQASLRSQTAGSDGAAGERGASGDDRGPHQRRAQGREQARQAPNNPHPGVFA